MTEQLSLTHSGSALNCLLKSGAGIEYYDMQEDRFLTWENVHSIDRNSHNIKLHHLHVPIFNLIFFHKTSISNAQPNKCCDDHDS